MVTAVESPGIASAKEEAAAILFAREVPTTPVMSAPAPEQSVRVHEPSKYQSFARYHEPEIMPARPKAIDTTALRPYESYDEVSTTVEPQVVRPGIDSGDYTSAVASTSVTVETPVTNVVENQKTVTKIESPLDVELKEDTQYVVKFKNSTIVAMTIVATIFLLMAVLFVVNVVNLVTMSTEVSALVQQSTTLEERLTQGQNNLEQARAAAGNQSGVTHHVQYVAKAESTYTEPTSATVNSSFFDWLCHSLSRLFN